MEEQGKVARYYQLSTCSSTECALHTSTVLTSETTMQMPTPTEYAYAYANATNTKKSRTG